MTRGLSRARRSARPCRSMLPPARFDGRTEMKKLVRRRDITWEIADVRGAYAKAA